MEWKHNSSPKSKKFKCLPSPGKVMLTLFWDPKGPILEHYQDGGQTINITRYCAILEEEMEAATGSKCRGMLTN
jgi:hypothetical protein